MESTAPAPCPSCGHAEPGDFCPACGERMLQGRPLRLRDFLAAFFNGLTNLESRFLLTLRRLLTRPGHLSTEYRAGRRVRSMRPIGLFFVANLVYFVAQPVTGWNSFNTSLLSHAHKQPYSEWTLPLIQERIDALGMTDAEYAAAFDRAGNTTARLLLIALAPLFAILFLLAQFRSRRDLAEHLLLALEYTSFQLLYVSVLFAAAVRLGTLAWVRFGISSVNGEVVGSTMIVLSTWVWTAVAFRRYYGNRGKSAWLRSAFFASTFLFAIFAYRFLIFWAAFWSVG